MAQRLNPPPGWPDPPGWWTPPPGWTPDPSWPEPPPGWPLWVDEDVPLPPHRPPVVDGTAPPVPSGGDVSTAVLGRAALALAAVWVVVEVTAGRPWTAAVVAALAVGSLGVAGLALGRVRWAHLRGRLAAGVLVVAAVGLLVAARPLSGDGGSVDVDVPPAGTRTSAPAATAPADDGGETPTPSPAVAPPTSPQAG